MQDSHDRPEQSDERCSGPDRSQPTQAAFQLGMDDSLGALKRSLGRYNRFPRNLAAFLVRPELHEARGYDLGQMTLLVAFGYFDSLIDFAVAQRASHGRSKCPGLLSRGIKGHPAI